MGYNYDFHSSIELFVEGRIDKVDAKRQEKTAKYVLKQLEKQPGQIIADEVGMGKTFVALSVAASVALGDNNKKPVVVMVPSNLSNKWEAKIPKSGDTS